MKQDVKDKWVAALRSDKYKQGIGALRNVDGEYCCIGVLYDVLGACWLDSSPGMRSIGARVEGGAVSHTTLTGELKQTLGISTQECVDLITMNDNDCASFEQIAKHIEAKL